MRYLSSFSIADSLIDAVPNGNLSLVIEVKEAFIDVDTETMAVSRRSLEQISRAISRDYPAISVLHTHQTKRKGSSFSPHIHLLLLVPEAKKKVFLEGISKDMARRDKRGYFRLVADDIETSSQVKSWSKLVRYVSGQFRHNPPGVLWVNGQSARAANNPKHWDDLRTIRESRTADGALVSSVLPELPDIQTERVSQ